MKCTEDCSSRFAYYIILEVFVDCSYEEIAGTMVVLDSFVMKFNELYFFNFVIKFLVGTKYSTQPI